MVWKRIRNWLNGQDYQGEETGPEEKGKKRDKPKSRSTAYLTKIAQPDARVNSEEISRSIRALKEQGRELHAVELLSRALRSRPEELEIKASLAFLLVERMDFDSAHDLLVDLTTTQQYGLRAEFLLGDHAERKGKFEDALRRYERVIAKDVTHAQALNRARSLREKLGVGANPMAQATVVQPEGASTKGRYQLIRELGRGGSAVVYLSKDIRLDREVALKVYHPQVMKEDGPQQLAREAALPSRIGHRGVIKVLDVDPKLGAIVMEYISGGSLKDLLKKKTLDEPTALQIVEAICRPLASLHNNGIVHRDIKPGNILVRNADVTRPILTDLGVALLPGEKHRPGMGTPAFMAPEQKTDENIDFRADIFAVGVMLAAMLGGYKGQTGPVGDLLNRCLSESPGGRPRDATELLQIVTSIRFALSQKKDYRDDLEKVASIALQEEQKV